MYTLHLHALRHIYRIILMDKYPSILIYIDGDICIHDHLHTQSSSSSYRAGSTDIPDPLSPLLPIVHRPRQVFRTTTCILT